MRKPDRRSLEQNIISILQSRYGYSPEEATDQQMYGAVLSAVQNILLQKRGEYLKSEDYKAKKRVYYLSMEFLLGPSLKNHLYNLGLTKEMEEILREWGFSLSAICKMEPDAGLGNGGLGRLAACYLDAATTLEIPMTGFCIRYEFGIFKQRIVDGWQLEFPDDWLEKGSFWLSRREDEAVKVNFGGKVREQWSEKGLTTLHTDCEVVRAVPYDMMISGHKSDAVNSLRLWRAVSEEGFDMERFSRGDHIHSMEKDAKAEAISKILYPADDTREGKVLRLRQQYFFVSASLQTIIRDHLVAFGELESLPQRAVIHINDTHPALCIPELMRILMDECGCKWEKAWELTQKTIAYTNHTVMSEALERWDISLFEEQLPRIYSIVKEIDRRFCEMVYEKFPQSRSDIGKMSILSDGTVNMANLCLVACFSVNGVSALHTEILKNDTFKEFHRIFPEKLVNITNGVSARRWLCQNNQGLHQLLLETCGEGYENDFTKLKGLLPFAEDRSVLSRLGAIKRENKLAFAKRVLRDTGIILDPDSLFDVQAKRLHEYKRQLLNGLHILHLYLQTKNHGQELLPQTFLFGAKAAPGYYMAKEIIRFLCAIGETVGKDPLMREKLRVVFLENFRVSLAEELYPAAELSEQISLAGKEASGTGNMKMMLNGALTIGTKDGANIEIALAAGEENLFLFGMDEAEVKTLSGSYRPYDYYQGNAYLREVIDFVRQGGLGKDFSMLMDDLINHDPYFTLADFESYRLCRQRVNEVYGDPLQWNRMSLKNIASAGVFSADRSIREYLQTVWERE